MTLWVDGLASFPGSTRAVSVVRILWVLLVWAEFGSTFRLHESIGAPDKLVLAAVLWLGSIAMLVGAWSRLASAVTGGVLLGSWMWLGELGVDDHFRRHHVYTLAIVAALLAATPCGGSFSLDRLWEVRAARASGRSPPSEHGDLWATRLVQLQVAAMYLWAAYDKTSPVFGQRMEMYTSSYYFGAEHPGVWFSWAMAVAGYGSVVLEYVLPFALWFPRTRVAAVVAGVVFHAVIYWTLSVATYSCSMFVLYLLFLDPAAVHARIDELVGAD